MPDPFKNLFTNGAIILESWPDKTYYRKECEECCTDAPLIKSEQFRENLSDPPTFVYLCRFCYESQLEREHTEVGRLQRHVNRMFNILLRKLGH